MIVGARIGRAEGIASGEAGTILLDRPGTDGGVDHDDWFTIKGIPWVCVCGASKPYIAEDESPHRIIVWPSISDPNLARAAREIRDEDGVAEIVRYEKSMGPAVSHYEKTPS